MTGRRISLLLIGVVFTGVRLCWAYSPLTHEEIVDILWKDQIQPMLLDRYPGSTPEQLQLAHAYAYGGCLIQDIGYYPFSDGFYSYLTHGVRTGDFVANLLRGAVDLDGYAFALGALTHYASDSTGHPYINRATALYFPKLRAKYGESVTFADCPKAHVQTEFGFEITQVAKNRYTSDQYHDFIGFEVAKPLLERAFLQTYGLPLEDALGKVDLAIGTFRRSVSRVIPEVTRAALTVYHAESVRDIRDSSQAVFLYNLSRAQYEKEWGRNYRKSGFFTRVLGSLLRLVPKVGVFRALGFKRPTPQTEDLYFKSVNHSLEDCRRLLLQASHGDLTFPDLDLDTGAAVAPGEYRLTNHTYARLLEAIIKRGQANVSPELRANILAFFAGMHPPLRTRKEPRAWHQTTEELEGLRAGPGSALAARVRKRLLAPPRRIQSPKVKDE